MPVGDRGGRDRVPPHTSDAPRVDALLGEVGEGDVRAFGAFYDRTAPVVFGLLRGALGRDAPAERATERIYRHVWHCAPLFDPARDSAFALLLHAVAAECGTCGGGGSRPS